ncbi:hypothetical protein [Streptomyces sp. MUM 203J]|uniref:hypothetical protein n=1 Tax=Streptomyces sp. MUM 203J TaxID=2791990 RepID=UPI001F0392CA|nr:hypothetical protein [Streptomyces sp. MUM 203J]
MGTRTPSDEEWDDFLRRAAQEGDAGAPKEPSARAREVSARLRNTGEPEGWRTWPASRVTNGTARGRRRKTWAAVGVLVALGLAVVAVKPDLVTDRLPGGGAEAAAADPLPAETARPGTAPPEELLPDLPTLEEPFRGSPALRWADGAEGIEVPAAKAVGGLTEEQVAAALGTTRELLIAANLDPGVRRGEHPEKALELFDPHQEKGADTLREALSKPRRDLDPTTMFSRFDPSEVRPVGDVVKTRGRLTYEADKRPGGVLVHADYTFVYPLRQARPGATEVARAVVRREMTVAFYDPARYGTTPGKLFLITWNSASGNNDCARPADGHLHPMFQSDLLASPQPTKGEPIDPYDRSKPLDALPKECRPATRT